MTLPTLWLIPTILARNTQKLSNLALYSVILMIASLVALPASIVASALQPSVEKAHFVGDGGLFSAGIMVVKIADLIGRPTTSKPVVALADVLFGLPVSHAVTLTLGVGLSAC